MKRLRTKKKDRPPSLIAAVVHWLRGGGGGGETARSRAERERALARARLRTRLPPHLLKDIGLWDD
jgi:hypothetical protein